MFMIFVCINVQWNITIEVLVTNHVLFNMYDCND